MTISHVNGWYVGNDDVRLCRTSRELVRQILPEIATSHDEIVLDASIVERGHNELERYARQHNANRQPQEYIVRFRWFPPRLSVGDLLYFSSSFKGKEETHRFVAFDRPTIGDVHHELDESGFRVHSSFTCCDAEGEEVCSI